MAKYFMPAARCQETRELVKKQDLSGRRLTRSQRQEAWRLAEALAQDMSQRLRQTWTPELIEYD